MTEPFIADAGNAPQSAAGDSNAPSASAEPTHELVHPAEPQRFAPSEGPPSEHAAAPVVAAAVAEVAAVAEAPLAAEPEAAASGEAASSEAVTPEAPAGDAEAPAAERVLPTDYGPEPRSFEEMNLLPEVLQGLLDMGFTAPMPVQRRVYRPVLAGRDLLVQSRTGSGKTAAFGIPFAQGVIDPAVDCRGGKIQALVLGPTRELALQVATEIGKIAVHRGITVVPIYGGAPMGRQMEALAAGAQAVSGTPGRVLDHLRRGTLNLSRLRMLVLDEADEMLSMGFYEEIIEIIKRCPKERQTMLFSATMPEDVERISKRHMIQPLKLTLSSDSVGAAEIQHAYYLVSGMGRTRDLMRVLDAERPESAIIFCNTREETNLVAEFLRGQGLDAEAISSDLSQADRERVMGRSKAKNLKFLVATDIAARGIDISDLSHVINFTFPESAEVYVHRTGRTGRAGKSGVAISLIGPRELGSFYYLKLTYRIRPQERCLPSEEELQTLREGQQVDRLLRELPREVNPSWRSLLKRVNTSDEGERILAALLERHLAEPRPVIPARPERSDRSERYERSERPRFERSERPDRGPRGERSFGERSERGERSFGERSERPAERSDRPAERSDRGERSERPPERSERPPERSERPAERSERNERSDRPGERGDRGERFSRPSERGPGDRGPRDRDRDRRGRREREEEYQESPSRRQERLEREGRLRGASAAPRSETPTQAPSSELMPAGLDEPGAPVATEERRPRRSERRRPLEVTEETTPVKEEAAAKAEVAAKDEGGAKDEVAANEAPSAAPVAEQAPVVETRSAPVAEAPEASAPVVAAAAESAAEEDEDGEEESEEADASGRKRRRRGGRGRRRTGAPSEAAAAPSPSAAPPAASNPPRSSRTPQRPLVPNPDDVIQVDEGKEFWEAWVDSRSPARAEAVAAAEAPSAPRAAAAEEAATPSATTLRPEAAEEAEGAEEGRSRSRSRSRRRRSEGASLSPAEGRASDKAKDGAEDGNGAAAEPGASDGREARSAAVGANDGREARSAAVGANDGREARSAAVNDREARSAAVNDQRLYLNLGRRDGADEQAIATLLEARGIPGLVFDLRSTHTYLMVPEEQVEGVMNALNGQTQGERSLRCERARR